MSGTPVTVSSVNTGRRSNEEGPGRCPLPRRDQEGTLTKARDGGPLRPWSRAVLAGRSGSRRPRAFAAARPGRVRSEPPANVSEVAERVTGLIFALMEQHAALARVRLAMSLDRPESVAGGISGSSPAWNRRWRDWGSRTHPSAPATWRTTATASCCITSPPGALRTRIPSPPRRQSEGCSPAEYFEPGFDGPRGGEGHVPFAPISAGRSSRRHILTQFMFFMTKTS